MRGEMEADGAAGRFADEVDPLRVESGEHVENISGH